MRLPVPQRRRLPWLVLAGVLVATALVYAPGTHGSFLLDDYPNIVSNPDLKIPSLAPKNLLRAAMSGDSGPLGRPIAMASFAINYHFTGMHPGPMKVTNLAIHLLNGLLLFLLLRALLRAWAARKRTGGEDGEDSRLDWLALAVTAAWLLAPINLTAVLYVVQRMTSLAATFTLLGLLAYVAGRRRLVAGKTGSGLALFAATLVATALATFTKEDGALTLLYAFVIEWTIFAFRRGDEGRSRLTIAYFVVFLLLPAAGAVAWLLPGTLHPSDWASRSFGLGERLLSEGRVIWDYFVWSLFPDLRQLTLYHDGFAASRGLFTPWTTLLAWAGIAVFLAAGILLRRRRPLVSLGILWFLAGQVLTASFIPLELVFEHREYLPSLGLYLALFAPIALAEPRARLLRARAAALAAIVLLYGGALALRSLDWSNPLLQAAIAAKAHPDSPRATYGYGRTLAMFASLDPDIVPRARAALETASRVPGQTTLPDSALILLAHNSGEPMRREWFADMEKQLHRRAPGPEDIAALDSLVTCAIRRKNPCRFPPYALDSVFAAALTGRAPNGYLMAIYGNYLLNARRDPGAAAGIFRALVHLSPRTPAYHFNLGVCEANLGHLALARAELATLKRLNRFGLNDSQVEALTRLIAHP